MTNFNSDPNSDEFLDSDDYSFMTPAQQFEYDLEHSFYLDPHHSEQCKSYYILRWTGKHLASMVSFDGEIIHQGKTYLVSFRSPHDSARCYSSAQVKISFRFPNDPSSNGAYAVVRRIRLSSDLNKHVDPIDSKGGLT